MGHEVHEEFAELASALRLHAERERRRGRRRLAAPGGAPAPLTAVAPDNAPAPATSTTTTTRPAPQTSRPGVAPTSAPDPSNAPLPAQLAPQAASLEVLRESVATCRACGLCETRSQTVFSDGNGSARVMFVGEAPGADEDASGVPFVGRAGQLLTDIITKGMKLRREDVYIANVLKCRPPGNRDPEPREKALCTPWLDRQIQLLRPQVIIPLGKHASQHMLGTEDSMGRMRGRVHVVNGQPIVPTYHPAFLLRSPHMKKECWADIQLAMGLLETPGPLG